MVNSVAIADSKKVGARPESKRFIEAPNDASKAAPVAIKCPVEPRVKSTSFEWRRDMKILPNAQDERAGCLARSVPERSEEIALTVTSNRLRSIALLGSFFISGLIKSDRRRLKLRFNQ